MMLRSKVFLSLLLVSVIPMAIIVAYLMESFATELKLDAERELGAVLDSRIQKIEAYVAAKKQLATKLARLASVTDALLAYSGAGQPAAGDPGAGQAAAGNDLAQIETQLRQSLNLFKTTHPQHNLFLLDTEGSLVFALRDNGEQGSNINRGEFLDSPLKLAVDQAMVSGRSQLSSFERFGQSSKKNPPYNAFVATPVFDSTDMVGILVVQVNARDYFSLTRDSSGLKNTGEMIIARQQGDRALVVAPLRNQADAEFNLHIDLRQDAGKAVQRAVMGQKGIAYGQGYNGVDVLAAWRYYAPLQWGVVVQMSSLEATANASTMRKRILVLAAALLVLAIVAAWYFSRRLVMPIEDLEVAGHKIVDGEVDVYVPTHGKDETGRLGFYLNSLAQRLNELTDAAEESARLKSAFLSNISHEIRTPMNGVLGMLRLLIREKLTEKQYRYAELARESADSLLLLVNDILDFSKIESGRMELESLEFDLCSEFETFAESLVNQVEEKGLELVLDISDIKRRFVVGDPGRLRQILMNLVSNAIKFTDVGEIVVRASVDAVSEDQVMLTCSVSDTGIGISRKDQGELFDSFKKIDASSTRQHGGAGLGLAIVKQLCDLMSGTISVESELGEGSCFTVAIPFSPAEGRDVAMPQVEIAGSRMLVVDDNFTNLESMNGLLTEWGGDVVSARSGAEAIDILFKNIDNGFAVAFLDMQMPGMDGAELGRRIRSDKRFDSMALVMMTSMAAAGDATFFASQGFQGFLSKPATPSDVFQILNIILENGEALKKANPLVTRYYIEELKQKSKTTRILLVEDNRINQAVAAGILEDMGYVVDAVGNGVEAIAALHLAPVSAPFDLVLMDCQMPVMDGYEATQRIRASDDDYASIPVIALTANALKGDRERCLDAGMNDYISKPIDGHELVQTLHKWLKKAEHASGARKSIAVAATASGVQYNPAPSTPEPAAAAQDDSKSKAVEAGTVNDEVWCEEAFMQRIKQKEKLARQLIKVFFEDMPGDLAELETAFKNEEISRCADVAHRIKGAAANMSGERLRAAAFAVEQSCKNGEIDGLAQLIDTLSVEYSTLEDRLQQHPYAAL